MVFEPNFTKVVSSVRKNVGMTQSIIELKLPTNESNITKIYSVGAKSTIISNENNGGDIVFNGLVDFQAVYDSGSIQAIDYCAEFKDRFVCEEKVDGELILSSNVIDVNSSVVAGGIKVVAIVEVAIDVISSQEMNVLTSVNGEDSHLSTGEITYSTYLGRAYEKIDVSEDIVVEGATNILMVTPSVGINNVEARENYIVARAKLNLDVFYQSGELASDIETQNHEVDFSWEVAFSGLDEDSTIQSIVSVIANEIKVSTIIEDGVAKMSVNVPVVYCGYVFATNKLSVVEDVYFEKNYLSVTCENFSSITCGNSIKFKDNISGTASISDMAPFIDQVLGVSTNNLVLASSRVEGDRLIIEGVTNATVVYFTKETGEITSVQVDMPFSVEQKVDYSEVGVVSICLDDMSARSKRGKEIEVSAGLNVYVDVFSHEKICVISDVLLGDEKPKDDCTLYVYVVKRGQTLWDVAKDTNTSQELILEQNPNVELPIKEGDKLVVYKSTMVEF